MLAHVKQAVAAYDPDRLSRLADSNFIVRVYELTSDNILQQNVVTCQ